MKGFIFHFSVFVCLYISYFVPFSKCWSNFQLKSFSIFIDTSIKIKYFNQASFSKFLQKQYLKEAPYNAYMWYIAPYTFTIRHAVTAIFSAGIILGFLLSFINSFFLFTYVGSIFLYLILAIFSSIQQSKRYNDLRLFFILPFCFFAFHFIHGLGVIKGFFLLLLKLSPVQIKR